MFWWEGPGAAQLPETTVSAFVPRSTAACGSVSEGAGAALSLQQKGDPLRVEEAKQARLGVPSHFEGTHLTLALP